jgi:hypothetical protein
MKEGLSEAQARLEAASPLPQGGLNLSPAIFIVRRPPPPIRAEIHRRFENALK